MSKRTYRMYGLVPYNLSPIQQGIQFGHAVVEYSLQFGHDQWYNRWAKNDKTFIILNGGTTNSRRFDGKSIGSLNRYREELRDRDILFADFYEPDLGDQLTAVVFLVDDRVFDREKWPDYDGQFRNITALEGEPETTEFKNWKMKFDEKEKVADNIVWMRDWLKNFRLA